MPAFPRTTGRRRRPRRPSPLRSARRRGTGSLRPARRGRPSRPRAQPALCRRTKPGMRQVSRHRDTPRRPRQLRRRPRPRRQPRCEPGPPGHRRRTGCRPPPVAARHRRWRARQSRNVAKPGAAAPERLRYQQRRARQRRRRDANRGPSTRSRPRPLAPPCGRPVRPVRADRARRLPQGSAGSFLRGATLGIAEAGRRHLVEGGADLGRQDEVGLSQHPEQLGCRAGADQRGRDSGTVAHP